MITVHYPNPVKVIAQARNTYHCTVLYNKSPKLNNLQDIAGYRSWGDTREIELSIGILRLLIGLNEILDASKIEAKLSSRIDLICKYNTRRVQHING